MNSNSISRPRRRLARLTALAVAASLVVPAFQAEAAPTQRQFWQTSLIGALGFMGVYSLSGVISRIQTTDWAGFGVGLIGATGCVLPAVGVSWYTTPRWFGGGWQELVNPDNWTGAGMAVIAFKFASVGLAAGGCAFMTRGVYNDARGYGYMGKTLHEPVKQNVGCDPKVYTCEKIPPAPSPSQRRLLAAAVESETTKAMSEEYWAFKAGKEDQRKMVYAGMQLSSGVCAGANVTRAQFDECQHRLKVFGLDAKRDQQYQATRVINAQIDKGYAARAYLRGLGYTKFVREGQSKA